MATELEIRTVREKLGPDAANNGWTDVRITEDLALNFTPNQIALTWWEFRAGSTTNLTSVSEAGSSRSLRDIHINAVAMADRYRKLVEADAAAVLAPPVAPNQTGYGRGIRTFPIRKGIK